MIDGMPIEEFFTIIGQQAVRIYMLEREKTVLQEQVTELLKLKEKEKEDGGLGRSRTD